MSSKKTKKKDVNINIYCIFILVVALFICGLSYILVNISGKPKNNYMEDNIVIDNDINKSIVNPSFDKSIYGTYIVKNDKKSSLSLLDGGKYILVINKCDGYLTLEGTFEIRDKKIILNNSEYVSDIKNLNNNEELSFIIIDTNTIRLEEELACLYQNTLFER